MKNKSNTALCKKHKLLYSHYCSLIKCNKFLCAKCVKQHDKGHLPRTLLQLAEKFTDDIEMYYRNLKMLKDCLAVLLLEKSPKKNQMIFKRLEEEFKVIAPPLQKFTDYIAEILTNSMMKQSIPIAESIMKFHKLKKFLSEDIRSTLSLLSLIHTNYKRQTLLWINSEYEFPDLDFLSQKVHFIDPIQKTTPYTLIKGVPNLSRNAQILYFNSTLLLVNAYHQELFQAILENGGEAHTATKFVPRANLISPIKTSFSLINLMNHTMYIIGDVCQKYYFFEDRWYLLPQLKLKKGKGVSACLVSNHYIYAFRGTGTGSINVEVLDLLAEDQGWSVKLTKSTPEFTFPISSTIVPIEETICFQQDNAGICLLGNIIGTVKKMPRYISGLDTTMLYYNMINRKLSRINCLESDIKCSSNYQVKDQGASIVFVENILALRRVWVYYRQLKKFIMKLKYIQHS